MTIYTPRQRLAFRHLPENSKGGSIRLGTATVLHNDGTATCLVPLSSLDDAKLEVRIRLTLGFVVARPGDDAHLFVRGFAGAFPSLAELAALGGALQGKRRRGVRELTDAATLRERWPLLPSEVRVFEIVDAADADAQPIAAEPEPAPEPEAAEPEPEPQLVRTGRADHDERREARVLRLRAGAAAARSEVASAHTYVRRMGEVMNGQPILVGHHSEKRHRRDIGRVDAAMRKACRADRDAKRLEQAAAAAERNTAIRADEPEAITRLREKLAELERQRETIKATNTACRRGDAAAIAVVRERCRHTADDPARGFPRYLLTNLGAEIRRVQQRIDALVAERTAPARTTVELGEWSLRENVETNRAELRNTTRRSTKDEYRQIRSNGFVWSPSAGAFVRLLNANAWAAGQRLVAALARTEIVTAAE